MYLTLVAGIPTSRRAPKVAGPLHIWKRASPPGHSSPVFSAEHLFLTALDGEKLYTWRRLDGRWSFDAQLVENGRVTQRLDPDQPAHEAAGP